MSKRSRRQKGILAFVARDADARMFAWANTDIRKEGMSDEIVRFVEGWENRTGRKPRELVFDSGFTTYANLGRLDEMGIRFLTLRRRSDKMLSELIAKPSCEWKKIRLSNVGREYRTPKIYEQRVKLKDYSGSIRQIAIKGLGRRKPVLLLTNQMDEGAANLIDRYARRMIIENTIADAIDFFHMDALSAAVAMKVNVDAQLTVMASGLYRVLGKRVGRGYEVAKARTIFRDLVKASGKVEIRGDEIAVTLGRRTNNPLLKNAGYGEMEERISWLDNRVLRIRFL